MIVFINGEFVPEADAKVSIFDRSFLYGDGLFETVRICNGKPFRWAGHLDRLQCGAGFLAIDIPYTHEAVTRFASQLIAKNQVTEALLRLTLSRGVGARGYSPKGADRPTLVMTLHPLGTPHSEPAVSADCDPETSAPPQWQAHTTSLRLAAGDRLAEFKTCNKLIQVLARSEAEAAGADEALLMNTEGFVVEAATGNLFWIQDGTVFTPPLSDGVLRGITRGVVCELCRDLGLPMREAHVTLPQLHRVDAAFLSLSSLGIVELSHIDGASLGRSPMVATLFNAYHALVRAECA